MTIVANPKQLHNPLKQRVSAVHNAVVAAVVVWVLEVHVLGINLGAKFRSAAATTLGMAQIIGVSLFVSLAWWGLLALIERRLAHAAAPWTVIAVGVFLASLGPPASLRQLPPRQ